MPHDQNSAGAMHGPHGSDALFDHHVLSYRRKIHCLRKRLGKVVWKFYHSS